MKKKFYSQLTTQEVIHCSTKEEFVRMIAKNPNAKSIDERDWETYKDQTYYRPKGQSGQGSYADIEFAKQEGWEVLKSKDF